LIFTLAGQFADRIGGVIAAAVAGPVISRSVDRYPLDWSSAGVYFALNFVISALAIGGLALFFCRQRWRLSAKGRWSAALAAAVVTNPAYGMVIGVMRYQDFLASLPK
jgi:hypothetical protein